MMKAYLITAALLISAIPATAADLARGAIEPAAPMAATFSWTGFYAGVHAGYGWGHTQDKNNPVAESKKIHGWRAGVHVGYNYQFDSNLVLGAEADVSVADIKNEWHGANRFDPYSTEDKIKAFGTARLRLGYAIDRFLPYVTGGLLWTVADHDLSCIKANAPAGTLGCKVSEFSESASATKFGWTVGAGLEYAVADNWTIRGEYLYGSVRKDSVTLPDVNYPKFSGRRQFDTNFSVVRIGGNYKF